ncbi:unnamed protein product [Caenorhabditis brenneri]
METTVAINKALTIIDSLIETNRVLQGDNHTLLMKMEGMSIELAEVKKKLDLCRRGWIRDSSKISAMNDMVDEMLEENKKMRIKIYRSNRSNEDASWLNDWNEAVKEVDQLKKLLWEGENTLPEGIAIQKMKNLELDAFEALQEKEKTLEDLQKKDVEIDQLRLQLRDYRVELAEREAQILGLTHLSAAREKELKRHSIDLDMSCWASNITKKFTERMEAAETKARNAKEAAIEADKARVMAEGRREDALKCWREAQQAEEEAIMRMERVFEQHGALVDRVKKAEDQAREARIDSRRRGPVRSVFKCTICLQKFDFDSEKNMKPKILSNCGHTCCEKCVSKMTIGDNVKCPYCRKFSPLKDCTVVYKLQRTGEESSDTSDSEGEEPLK